jgi:FdhD protein
MTDETKRINALLITDKDRRDVEEVVTTEFGLTIVLNNREIVTLLCTPSSLKQLAVGYLASEGLLTSKEEIARIILDDRRGVVRVDTTTGEEPSPELLSKRLITSGCGRGSTFYTAADAQSMRQVQSDMTLSTNIIFELMREFQHRSQTFKATGGVHSAALCSTSSILLFSEDIGRHNAIDKIFGSCLLEDIPLDNLAIMTSGRVSSEILLKVAKRNIPILISKSAPTDVAVKLAESLGITLIGFVRGTRMNVYANSQRVIDT